MQGLKKIALATAVAAAPFAAQAELKALDDSDMGNVTGQAGVTVELQTHLNIGSFTYTDEGDFAVNGIEIGGGLGTTGTFATDGTVADDNNLDNLKFVIDVEADGDASIVLNTTDNTSNPVDFGMTVQDMSLNGTGGETTLLASNLALHGDLAQFDIRVDTEGDNANQIAPGGRTIPDNFGSGSAAGAQIANPNAVAVPLAAGTQDVLRVDVAFDIDDLDVDVPFLAVGIRDMVITGGAGDPSAGNEGTVDLTATPPANADFASVNLAMYKGTSFANSGQDALAIDVNVAPMDVSIGSVLVGGTSIGSVALDNLAITNTSLRVYGHD